MVRLCMAINGTKAKRFISVSGLILSGVFPNGPQKHLLNEIENICTAAIKAK
jgi:hypothetical protein